MNVPEYTPALIVAVPLLGAFLTPLISRINDKLRNIFVILVLGLNSLLVGLLAFNIFTKSTPGSPFIYTYIFGAKDVTLPVVRILFEVDAMSIFMAIIASILVFVAVIYSWSFMKENTGHDKKHFQQIKQDVNSKSYVTTQPGEIAREIIWEEQRYNN